MKSTANALLNKMEFPVLLAGLVIAGGLWGLVELIEVARATTPHAFDTQILLAFRHAGQPDGPLAAGPHDQGLRTRPSPAHHRVGWNQPRLSRRALAIRRPCRLVRRLRLGHAVLACGSPAAATQGDGGQRLAGGRRHRASAAA